MVKLSEDLDQSHAVTLRDRNMAMPPCKGRYRGDNKHGCDRWDGI